MLHHWQPCNSAATPSISRFLCSVHYSDTLQRRPSSSFLYHTPPQSSMSRLHLLQSSALPICDCTTASSHCDSGCSSATTIAHCSSVTRYVLLLSCYFLYFFIIFLFLIFFLKFGDPTRTNRKARHGDGRKKPHA